MNLNDLTKLPPKILKEYINAYHLPANAAIEKTDLIKIIFNTRPVSNENESYYRKYRPQLTFKENSDSFSFSNLFNSQQRRQSQQGNSNQNQQQQQQRSSTPPGNQRQRVTDPLEYPQQRRQAQYSYPQQQRRQEPNTPQQSQSTSNSFLNTPKPTPSHSTPSPSYNNNLLSLQDVIKSNIDPATLSVRTLKSILKANFVAQSHAIEKSELVKLVKRLVDQEKRSKKHDSNNDEGLCRVCCDAEQNCVFLDCGHMVTCMDCAKKLIQTKNECPICRDPIIKLVHVFRS